MGSPCELLLYVRSRRIATEAAQAAIAEIGRLERRYSRYRADSDLSEINRIARRGGAIRLDPETANLIDHAFAAWRWSDGLFDITSGPLREIWRAGRAIPPGLAELTPILARIGLKWIDWRRPTLLFGAAGMELDFGGLAKEYAADCAAAVCRAVGVAGGVVSLGGDIAVIGPGARAAPWRIGVNDPAGGGGARATLFVRSGGIATSGDYARFVEIDGRRFGHVFDPTTGCPTTSLSSVTVAAESCLEAGTIATIGLLKGAAGAVWLAASGADCLWIEATGEMGGSILTNRQCPIPAHSPPAPLVQ